MSFVLCIDDTDNVNTPGSGQLAQQMVEIMFEDDLISDCSSIARHQLFFHRDIPYTSHNSAMSFCAELADKRGLDDVINFATGFLEKNSASGSDPGLCVVNGIAPWDQVRIAVFGLRAKAELMTKQSAYQIANISGIHLSEHGGTGDGVIGAIAGAGLRITGNDGRLRGWLDLGEKGEILTVEELTKRSRIAHVASTSERILSATELVRLSGERIKAVFHRHMEAIPVTRDENGDWITLTAEESKKY